MCGLYKCELYFVFWIYLLNFLFINYIKDVFVIDKCFEVWLKMLRCIDVFCFFFNNMIYYIKKK